VVTYSKTISGTTYTIDVKTNWVFTDKINFGDFNRIEDNVIILRNLVIATSYSIPSITSETGRTKTYIEYLSSINRIEGNLQTIRNNSFTPLNYGGTVTWDSGLGFDFSQANRIENNILSLFLGAGNVFDALIYSGQVNAGYSRGDIALV
jgi:hypothetical protein